MFIDRDAFFQMVVDRLGPHIVDIDTVYSLQKDDTVNTVYIDNNSTTLTFVGGCKIFLNMPFPYAGEIYLT